MTRTSRGNTPLGFSSGSDTTHDKSSEQCISANLIGSQLVDELKVGQIVSGYKLIEEIGRGGMGIVFLAEYLPLGRVCAVKFLAPYMVSTRSWIMFQKEAKLVAALRHPTFCRVFDMGVHKGLFPFYSMEHITGNTLEQLLSEAGTLPVATVLNLLLRAADGLYYAHSQGIVHKDIKPANIMLSRQEDGEIAVKILDFGIAELCDKTLRPGDKHASQSVRGTCAYMSPERFDNKKLDGRCDIYSLGCTAFEALTGTLPYADDSWIKSVWQHKNVAVPQLCDWSKNDFPAGLQEVLEKMLAKNPEDRYKSADQLAFDVQCMIDGKPLVFAKGDWAASVEMQAIARESKGGEREKKPGQSILSLTAWLFLSALACCAIAPLVPLVLELQPPSQHFHRSPSRGDGKAKTKPRSELPSRKVYSQAEIDELLDGALRAFEAGQYKKAVEGSSIAINNGGNSGHAYCLRGAALFHLEMPQQAVSDLKKAISIDPKLARQADVHEMKAMCHADLDQLDAALSEAGKSIDLMPNAGRFKLKGEILRRLKRNQEAVASFSKGLSASPDSYWLLADRAEAYVELRQYDLALKDYNRMIELRPDAGRAYADRAKVFDRLGQSRQAESNRIKSNSLSFPLQ